MKLPQALFASLLWLASFASLLYAQGERGTITGTVSDSTGAVIAEANVTVRNVATNATQRTQSNSSGLYVFPALNPGAYEISVEKAGFKARRVTGINLSVNLTATIDAQLEVGSVTETLNVEAAAVLLEAQTSGMGKTVESRRVVELPLLGRNPLQLAALAPGVIPTRGQVGAGGDAIGQAGNSRIAGGLANQNAILMDGGDARGFTSGGQAYTFPIESVAEFKVETATYSAEFGRAGGGVVNVASRSGTNQYHGVGYWFLRNDHLNANSWSNNRNRVARALFQRNEGGGALGGPIKKDRTFFFANYEFVRQGSPRNFLATVPQAGLKSGNFSQLRDRTGAQVEVFDPLTTRNVGASVVRDMFPGNVIPASRIHPISANVAKFWPDANRAGEGLAQVNNYFIAGKNVTNVDLWFTRIDHQINDKHRIFGRFGGEQNDGFSKGLVEAAFPATTVNSNPSRNAGISLTSTFSPNLLGELRFSYTRLQNNSAPVSEGFDLASLGFPTSLANAVTYKQFPQILVQQYATGTGLAVATFGADEVSGLGGAGKNLLPQDTWHGQYHVTWIRGRHRIKAGADFQRMKMGAFNSRNSAGQFVFDRTFTQGPNPAETRLNGGNAFASFLLGIPVSGSIETTPYMMLFQRYNAGYIQDDWRVNSKLTLNLGFRYEYTSPYGEKFGQIGYFDSNATEPVTGRKGLFKWVPPGGYHHNPNYKTFGPRLGIAYALNNKTVIRTGGGIFNAANNGLNAAASDFGSGLFTTNSVFLGEPNPIRFTPPVGGSWSNPFAAGLVLPEKGVTTFVGQNIRVDFPDHKLAYLINWNFSIQRQLSEKSLIEVAYVGTKATHLFWNRFDNANDPLLLQQWGSGLLDPVPNPFFGQIRGGALGAQTIQRRQLLRPFPQYQQILAVRRPYGDSHYQSFTARYERAYHRGFTLSAAYTASKLIASTAESNTWVIGPSNALYDHKYNRGVDANDTPHRLVLSHLWDLPFGIGKGRLNKGAAARVLGNWQFSGVTVVQAGRPILISAPDNTGLFEFAYTNGRADRLKSGVIDNPTKEKWFDTTAFRAARAFTVPTDSLSQPDLRTPWRQAVNWSVFKNNPITWGDRNINIQFRTEMYNVFNTPQFDVRGASTDVSSALFGQITEGGGERNIQFGLRIVF
ncbi:MAG: carboxypeptidase regulatory-like domain-containing protein [Bryobacterales bacterium]|nr:carboxypeptidase regulatory-like domain-containing protein [Bryobacterales bacterium]